MIAALWFAAGGAVGSLLVVRVISTLRASLAYRDSIIAAQAATIEQLQALFREESHARAWSELAAKVPARPSLRLH